jgi:hypothetical protein
MTFSHTFVHIQVGSALEEPADVDGCVDLHPPGWCIGFRKEEERILFKDYYL